MKISLKPIGLVRSPVALLGRDRNVLRVQGLDAIEGTPLLDLKPYVPAFDRVDAPTVPDWVSRLMQRYF